SCQGDDPGGQREDRPQASGKGADEQGKFRQRRPGEPLAVCGGVGREVVAAVRAGSLRRCHLAVALGAEGHVFFLAENTPARACQPPVEAAYSFQPSATRALRPMASNSSGRPSRRLRLCQLGQVPHAYWRKGLSRPPTKPRTKPYNFRQPSRV